MSDLHQNFRICCCITIEHVSNMTFALWPRSRSQESTERSKLAYFSCFRKLVQGFSSNHYQNWIGCAKLTYKKHMGQKSSIFLLNILFLEVKSKKNCIFIKKRRFGHFCPFFHLVKKQHYIRVSNPFFFLCSVNQDYQMEIGQFYSTTNLKGLKKMSKLRIWKNTVIF